MNLSAIAIILISDKENTGRAFSLYYDIFLLYNISWLLFSYFYKRYTKVVSTKYVNEIYKLVWTSFSVFIFLSLFFLSPINTSYSIKILVILSMTNILLGTFYYLIDAGMKNAVEYKQNEQNEFRKPGDDKKEVKQLSPVEILKDSIIEYASDKVLKYISSFVSFDEKNNLVSFSANFFEIKSKPGKKFTSISILNHLNDIRSINSLFSVVNHKLPMHGIFVVCFEQSSTRKKKIIDQFPPGLNLIIYFFDYLIHRVMPKLRMTSKFYFDLTKARNRALSKTEVLGRLVYCGFDITNTKKIDGITYVIAHKNRKLDEILVAKQYGPLLKLRRMGKNGKVFEVYKFRTMYPYAEYIQAYIFKHSSLQKGGKFNRDIRVNTLGKFMRKFWIDETPMFMNLLKGEMKLVGVRPLSLHYFSLYSPELQYKRKKFMPGLLPPFYADMPETLDEIQASEMRYLVACEKHGTFITDFRYFFKILHNILIKKARSA
jgi:lipopolysaccharide/colanic/teichoic acid biosynthesis glycosyltransferase